MQSRPYWSVWPVTQPGLNGPVGGCGADLPRNMAIVAGLSSLGLPVPVPPRSPPRRQCTEPALDARNFTQPSCASWPALRSVVSGFASDPPSNGTLTSVPGDVNFDA